MLLLDDGGVLHRDYMNDLYDLISAESKENVSSKEVEIYYRSNYRNNLWSGEISIDDFWKAISERFEVDIDLDSFIQKNMTVLPAALKVPFLSQRYTLGILSNHRSEWLLPRLEFDGITEYIDKKLIFISDQIKAVKPDAKAYKTVIQRSGFSSPEEITFVDDKQRNLEAAKSLGIKTILAGEKAEWVTLLD